MECKKCDGTGYLFYGYDDCSYCDECENKKWRVDKMERELKVVFTSQKVKYGLVTGIELATDNGEDYYLTTLLSDSCSVVLIDEDEMKELHKVLGEVLNG